MIAIIAQGSSIFAKDPSSDFINIQGIADDLGGKIENELNQIRVDSLGTLDGELDKARENYLDIISQTYKKHLDTTAILVSTSLDCYLKFEPELSAAYKTAGEDVADCLVSFNEAADNIIVPSFDDAILREYPVELPSFILAETGNKNIFAQPDVTINALIERQTQIELQWNTEHDQLKLREVGITLQFQSVNRNLNDCFLKSYIDFRDSANVITEESKKTCF